MKTRRLPRTLAELQKQLSNATVAGYFAGFRDNNKGLDAPPWHRPRIRRAVRAELQRWMNQ